MSFAASCRWPHPKEPLRHLVRKVTLCTILNAKTIAACLLVWCRALALTTTTAPSRSRLRIRILEPRDSTQYATKTAFTYGRYGRPT